MKNDDDEFPYRTMSLLCFVVVAESCAGSCLIPFIGRMITLYVLGDATLCSEGRIAPENRESCARIGYLAGVATSAYFLGQFVSGFFWTYISDFAGRKPVMIVGLVSNGVAGLCFGLAPTLWSVVLIRFLNGCMNPNTVITKVYIGEITSEKTQAFGFSVRAAFYGLGSIVGTMIGGFLAEPHLTWLSFLAPSGSSLLTRYPYLLPSLASAAMSLVGAIGAAFFMPETLKNRHELRIFGYRLLGGAGARAPPPPAQALALNTIAGTADADAPLDDGDGDGDFGAPAAAPNKRENPWLAILKNRNWLLVTFNYMTLAVAELAFVELFGLWSLYPPQSVGRGLNFTPPYIGLTNAAAGIVMILFTLFVYVPVDRLLTTRVLMLVSFAVMMVGNVLFPMLWLLNLLPLPQGVLFPFLFVVTTILYVVVRIGATAAYATTAILLTNAVDRDQLAASQGMSTALASLCRTFAPAFGLSLFSWSISSLTPDVWPFGFTFIFNVFGCMYAFAAIASQLITRDCNSRRKKNL